jgi:steroid delta-isomerase-like uncharacterized protein
MALTRADMDRVIAEHFEYERTDDVDGVVATLAEDATHDIIGNPAGPTYGRENARPFYNAMFADLGESSVTPVKRLYGDGFVVDESLWEGVAHGAPFGIPGNGRPLKFRLLHVFEFNDAGEIQRENVWCDFPAIYQQLP